MADFIEDVSKLPVRQESYKTLDLLRCSFSKLPVRQESPNRALLRSGWVSKLPVRQESSVNYAKLVLLSIC